MTISLRQQQRAQHQSRRIGMTRLDHVMHFLSLTYASLRRFRFTQKHLRTTLLIILAGCVAGVASYFFNSRTVTVPYTWGTFAGCPSTFIDTSDPAWETNPLLHVKGGAKTTPAIQAEHMVACGLSPIRNEKERKRALRQGVLTKLTGKHLMLVDVEEPYVNPLMRMFVQRLSSQYFTEAQCGSLVVTSALRNLTRQRREIKNGSVHSVHPFGMSIDLRIPRDTHCQIWLRDALIGAEQNGRVDFTIETSPAHYHIVLVPGAYESWLMAPEQLNITPTLGYDKEEVHWLAVALYFEGAVDESYPGLQAIASVIKNRRDSKDFPDTIEEVVRQGAKGQSNGWCQFSFMCDGQPEQPWVLCKLHPTDTVRVWSSTYPCGRRWAAYHKLAIALMKAPDNTNKAVQYYAARMDPAPGWAKTDMLSQDQIGSHKFGRSRWLGEDLW